MTTLNRRLESDSSPMGEGEGSGSHLMFTFSFRDLSVRIMSWDGVEGGGGGGE